jgi:hypothetical protein
MMMTNIHINELHDEAMKFAQEAYMAQRQNKPIDMMRLSKEAFLLEKKAALAIPKNHPDAEPSRTILFKSAAFLAYDAEMYWECYDMITQAFSGKPDAQIKAELNELAEDIRQKGTIEKREEGKTLQNLMLLWRAKVRKTPISEITEWLNMSPTLVKKWLLHFEWMQQAEANGLTPTAIVEQINESDGESIVTEWNVKTLLDFFKTNPIVKKRGRVSKSPQSSRARNAN